MRFILPHTTVSLLSRTKVLFTTTITAPDAPYLPTRIDANKPAFGAVVAAVGNLWRCFGAMLGAVWFSLLTLTVAGTVAQAVPAGVGD
jgi:hypothetical protein